MMVDDLDDFGFVDAVSCLAAFVMVDEDDLALRALCHVGTRDDADAVAFIVEHDAFTQLTHENGRRRILQKVILVQEDDILFDELGDGLRERSCKIVRGVLKVFGAIIAVAMVHGGNVAIRHHAQGNEPLVLALFVGDDDRTLVVATQQAACVEQRGIERKTDGIGGHDILDARVNMVDELGRSD
ncbi:unknown [Eggerthella sp. CAG:298]|nr:unknown [Eggerthella sp. CAG:298]